MSLTPYVQSFIDRKCWMCITYSRAGNLIQRDSWWDCTTCDRSYRVAGDSIQERVPVDEQWRGKNICSGQHPPLVEILDGSIIPAQPSTPPRPGMYLTPQDTVAFIFVWP